ncbi:MAG: SCO family protein [Pedobacter sp.]|nr:MAG: SCO family protein [Pedobacter sp.]
MRKYSLFILSFILFFISACKQSDKLPIYGPREAVSKVDASGKLVIDTIYKTIPEFTFLNQDSIETSSKVMQNSIYVADFFFTNCSTICPIMHRNMKTLYDEYFNFEEVKFLSFTIDYKYDKPSVLKKYAQKLGVDNNKWIFMYGPKAEVYNLAEKDYLVAVGEDDAEKDGYIHQGWLVLIDKESRIRGAYDGTDDEQVKKLKADIAILVNEYK